MGGHFHNQVRRLHAALFKRRLPPSDGQRSCATRACPDPERSKRAAVALDRITSKYSVDEFADWHEAEQKLVHAYGALK